MPDRVAELAREDSAQPPWLRSPRFVLLVAPALLLVIVVIAALLTAGGSDIPPATDAASVVPGDALVYVHVSLDSSRPAVTRALRLASRFPDYPLLSAAVLTRMVAITGGGSGLDFANDVRPWLGREGALALLNTPTSTAGSLLVLDVAQRRLAENFLSRAGARPLGSYEGVPLLRYASGTELAFVSHYLVLGQDASVRAAIDVVGGRAPSLRANAAYRRATDGEPDDRVLDAYASAAGVRRLLVAQGGLVGAVGVLLYQPTMSATAISLSASSQSVRLRVHNVLDPALANPSTPRPVQFSPSLEQQVPAGSMLMLDVAGLDRIAPKVLSAGARGGVAGRVGPLLSRLGGALSAEGVNVQSIRSIFSGESAVAISPPGAGSARAGSGAAPGASQGPALIVVTHTKNESSVRTTLASLEAPLQRLFPPPAAGGGEAPVFNDRQVAGVTAHQLQLAPGLQLNYAVFKGLVVISTSLTGVGTIAVRSRALASDPLYQATLKDRPDQVTSLVFLNFTQLLSLAEQTGLTRSSRYRAIRSDLHRIRAVGLDSTSGENDTTAEIHLQIS